MTTLRRASDKETPAGAQEHLRVFSCLRNPQIPGNMPKVEDISFASSSVKDTNI